MISHYPEKKLSQHIKEVQNGAAFLLSLHSDKFRESISQKLLKYIIIKHDEGKKTGYFQEYIKDPKNYSGNNILKSHSKLSALLAVANLEEFNALEIYQILQCIGGHHSNLKSIDDLILYWSESEKDIIKQLENFPKFNLAGADKNTPTDFIYDFLEDELSEMIPANSIEYALKFRLNTQLLYSILLESDKAMLAVSDFSKHIDFKRNKWDKKWIDNFIGKPKQTPINILRKSIRNEVLEHLQIQRDDQIFTLTSPTGSGKTLLSATWALEQREKLQTAKNITPKIIIVLPFLSIINQTVEEYNKILKNAGVEFDGSWIMASHSLSERKYSESLEENEESFFIDTWRSDVIITTYDQFLYSIFNPKSKHQMRFHNLLDSVIVFDEIQSLPTMLWKPLDLVLQTITNISESRVLLMSATMPGFISKPNHLLPKYEKYFQSLNRYEIDFTDIINDKTVTVGEFVDEIESDVKIWIQNDERVLLTFNTRRSAQNIFSKVKNIVDKIDSSFPMFFISSDVVPEDRLKKIEEIKENHPCIVVSTQSIEAGVDIDMTKVIRDFAPLDSMIQIAGRCNRNAKYNNPKNIKIIQLKSGNGKLFSNMIYNDVHLFATREVLKGFSIVPENKVLSISKKYFVFLSNTTNTGDGFINNFAYWQDYKNIREVLRGEHIDKFEFCLLERDFELKTEIRKIAEIKDRWERREKYRRISGRIAKLTVSVIAKTDFHPEEIAEYYFGIWNLKNEFYDENIGIQIPDYEKVSSLVF